MSLIDVTPRLKTYQLRAAALEIYDHRDGKDIIHPRMFSRLNVRVTLTPLPQVGCDHPDGRMYTYRFTIKTVMAALASDGSLGRFHTQDEAEAALKQHLTTRALGDLRSLSNVFEAFYSTATQVTYDHDKRGFAISTGIPGHNAKWTWLRAWARTRSKNELPIGAELVMGEKLAIGEPELLEPFKAFCASLHFDNLWGFVRYMTPPSPLYMAQTLDYYYTTPNPDEYIQLTVKAYILKPGMLEELGDLLVHIER